MNGRIAKRIRRAAREQGRYWRLKQAVRQTGFRQWIVRAWATIRGWFLSAPKSGQVYAEPERMVYRAMKRNYTRGGRS